MKDSVRAEIPVRQVRALFDATTVRVYQAFSPEITDKALLAQTFKPPFKRERMTWVKPSFTWMMYRSAWGTKRGQERILAIDILRRGFEWSLANSCLSYFDPVLHTSPQAWQALLQAAPVRVQWDPERTLQLEALPWRTIQLGLRGGAVDSYLDEWIIRIEDVTTFVRGMEKAIIERDLERAQRLLPLEVPYPLPSEIRQRLQLSETNSDTT